MTDRYEQRGVSSAKPDVHAAIANLDQGLFPGAFCKILPDYLGGDDTMCMLLHADGAGTKAGLGYLYYKETGDPSKWPGILQDSLVMNIDDGACAGFTGPFVISLTIDRNYKLVDGDVIKALIQSCEALCQFLTSLGIPCYFAGGETADVGDLVRTLTVNNTIAGRMPREHVIDASRIRPGSLIVGFSSTGQADWEDCLNSGMGANGLTNARHDVLSSVYRQHTETYAPETDPDLIYSGKYLLNDLMPEDPVFTIGQALLSPTRTYTPLIKRMVDEIGVKHLQGLIHCSGGGQTKIGKFGPPDVRYVKNHLFPTSALFQMLQRVQSLRWEEMYKSYNMGHRLEAIVPTLDLAEECIALSRSCGIAAQIVGGVEPYDSKMPRVAIHTEHGTFNY